MLMLDHNGKIFEHPSSVLVSKFIRLPERPLVLTVQDPSEKVKSGYYNTNAVSVWFRDNRVLVLMSPLEYIKGITATRQKLFESLGDSQAAYIDHMKQWFRKKVLKKSLIWLRGNYCQRTSSPS